MSTCAVLPSRRPVDHGMLRAAQRAASTPVLAPLPVAVDPGVTTTPAGGGGLPLACAAVVLVATLAVTIVFLRPTPASAVRCAPIPYAVSTGGPADWSAQVDTAFQEAARVSGISFVRAPDLEDAVLAVAWSAPGALGLDPVTGHQLLGRADAEWLSKPGQARLRAGLIRIDQSAMARPGFATGDQSGVLVLHEIGHVLGLEHSEDPSGVMFPTVRDQAVAWAPDEVRRLRATAERLGC